MNTWLFGVNKWLFWVKIGLFWVNVWLFCQHCEEAAGRLLMLSALLPCTALLIEYMALLNEHMALLSEYMALFSKYMAILSEYMAVLSALRRSRSATPDVDSIAYLIDPTNRSHPIPPLCIRVSEFPHACCSLHIRVDWLVVVNFSRHDEQFTKHQSFYFVNNIVTNSTWNECNE